MGFLNPLFWVGVLAVAFPIWLHLRDRRVERVISLPTLRFLADEPAPASQPVRLRNPLLLLVRALVLLAVVAAFTRPWIAGDDRSALTESRVCQIHTKAVLQLRSKILAQEREPA